MNNNYWNSYKKKFRTKWHFDPMSKKNDYFFLGNIKTDFKKIDGLIKKIPKIAKIETCVDFNPKLKDKKILRRINQYKLWGYQKENTFCYRVFSKDYPSIFKKFLDYSGLEHATSSIIYQSPGQTVPWHYDTHIEFYKKLKKKGFKVKKKNVIRYMIFLKDWDYGHFFCVGSSVVKKWKKGDIITWSPHMHHSGSNGGISPKVTMNITGIIDKKKSLHLKTRKRFIF